MGASLLALAKSIYYNYIILSYFPHEPFYSFAALTREIFFQHEKRNFVSPSGHVMFYLLYKHQWNTKPFHFNSFFYVKGAVYYVAIAKGNIFTCEDIMFSRESSPFLWRLKIKLIYLQNLENCMKWY